MDPQQWDLYQYYVGFFLVLSFGLYAFRVATAKVAKHGQEQAKATVVTDDFRKFQRTYIVVYLIMMGADWLQGPYVYALYKHYNFTQAEIGRLFIAGFGSSLVFGTVVGSMADKYGRKKSCLLFGVLYALSCVTKHFSDYNTLLVGRVLGGLATSLLFSSFESWMVHEHHEHSYPEDWLGLTFSAATSGNGLIAIGSGVLASFVRESFGPVAPFDASLVLLVIGTIMVASQWKENYGDARIDLSTTVSNAWDRLWDDPKIMLLGAIQSFFEGSMYIFVFMWTPALEATSDEPILHGWIFASFMICVLVGSNLFSVLLRMGLRVERFSVYTFGIAALALFVPAMIQNHTIRLLSFFVFEGCVGMFWPSLGFMRSKYVPEEVRATVMNFFRIPLNMIVVIVLANISKLSELHVFAVCTACLLPALICQVRLLALTADNVEAAVKKGKEAELELEEHGQVRDEERQQLVRDEAGDSQA